MAVSEGWVPIVIRHWQERALKAEAALQADAPKVAEAPAPQAVVGEATRVANIFAQQNGWDGVNGAPEWLVELAQDIAAALTPSPAPSAAPHQGAELEQWKANFWAVARELNCLPSTFADANGHVLKAAIDLNAKLAAQEAPCCGWPGNGCACQVQFEATSTHQGADALREALKDTERLDWLERQSKSYGFEGIHEGNAWEVYGAYRSVRDAIDHESAAQHQAPQQGEQQC